MKWQGRRQSDNVEDRRGISGGKVAAGGGIIGLIILAISIFSGNGDSGQLIQQGLQQMQQMQQPADTVALSEEDKKMGDFVGVVLADTEDVWSKIFAENGMTYEKPKLVLFRNSVQTACGGATSQSGPFYCPVDKKVYMDLAFFEELKTRFGAQGGDFAIAYVIAHEVGHHVQNLLGKSGEVHERRQQVSEKEGNKLSVSLELQADFYAGIWAHYDQAINKILEEGDLEEALSAANAVGDDAIQKRMQGSVVPDSFTHGTSEQRMYWFRKGFDTGNMNLASGTFKD